MNRQPSAPEAGSIKPGTTGGTHKGLENIQPAPSPAGPANQRATKSGARSKVVLAEHAAPIAVELAARYPHADPAEIENEALRRAAIRLAADWIGTRGQIAKSDGQTLDIARRMVGWTRVSDGWYRDRRTQEQEAKRIDPDAAWDEALKEFNPPDADVVEDGDHQHGRDLDGEADGD